MNKEYNSIQVDYDTYKKLRDGANLGTDGMLEEILEYAQYIEEDDLAFFGLTQAFTTKPPGTGAKPPFICHVPQHMTMAPVFTLEDGYPGLEMHVKWNADIFIAGGHSRVPYSLAMMTSYSIIIPMCMLLLKNPSMGGTCRGVEILGADPASLPFAQEKTTTTWQGIAVHVAFNCYYQWRAG